MGQDAPRSPRLRTILLASGLVLWVLAPTLAIAWLTLAQSSQTFSQRELVLVHPRGPDGPIETSASLMLDWSPPISVVAPNWTGVLQRVNFSGGSTISSGDSVARVSGVDRVAFHSEEPFYRPLTLGDTGSDVAALNSFLRSRGLSAPDVDRFTTQTRTALIEFGRSIGVPTAVGRDFDPGWLVYLPREVVIVDSSDLTVGAQAPSPGTELFNARPVLEAAVLVQFQEPVTEDEQSASEPVSSLPITAGPDEQLFVGDSEYPFSEAMDAVAADVLADLGERLDPAARVITVTLRSPSDPMSWLLPSASLVQDADGLTCVVVDVRGISIPVGVEIVAERDGIVTVRGELDESMKVLVAAPTEYRSCR